MKPKDNDNTTSSSDTMSKENSNEGSNERSNEKSNERLNNGSYEADPIMIEPEPGHAQAKRNQFLKAFGNIFGEMKGNSIL